MEHFFIYNNKFYPAGAAVIGPGNRSLRYGDGLFETMRMMNGVIINKEFHFERLFKSLLLMQFDIPKAFTASFLQDKINSLLQKNKHIGSARIRLMAFRGNGGVFDPENLNPNYIIESWALKNELALNENGLIIDIFPGAKKNFDSFSAIKSNNYLPYIMAGLYAKKNRLNDSIILNSFERICESAIANIFIIKGEVIYTPPLTEGCVAGTLRRWLLEKFSFEKYIITEKSLSINDLLLADEFFLTNAVYYLRWVKSFREKIYKNLITKKIFEQIVQTI